MILLPAPIADFESYRQRRDERLASESRAPIPVRSFCVASIRRELADIDEGTAALNAAIDAAAGRPRVPRDIARLRGRSPELAVAALFTLRASRRRRFDPRRFIDMWHASACWRFARGASR